MGELTLSAESVASLADVVRRCASGLVRRGTSVFPFAWVRVKFGVEVGVRA